MPEKSWLTGPLLLLATGAQAGVNAADYHAFWLWGGVTPQPVLAQAKALYILQGQVSASRRYPEQGVRLIAQGISIPHLKHGEIWLVYRVHTLRWTPEVYRALLAQMQRWRRAGNPVVGLQIDFDARTRYLHEYVDFLRDLRHRLSADYRLSITGLLDWGSNADPRTINRLKGVVDEVVIQTYQGCHSIPDYAAYLPRVSRLSLPFKIGVIQHGEWQEPDYLRNNPWFRGYVVFLQNAGN